MSAAAPGPERRRRTVGPVVLVGLAASGLTALGGTRAWVGTDGATGRVAGIGPSGLATTTDVGEAPLAAALGLVLLACWGVLLVTRGWFRRAAAALGALAAAGVVAVAVTSARTLPDDVTEQLARGGTTDVDPGITAWLPVTALAALLALAACVAAVRLAPSWPEMGSRYDAPADAATTATTRAPETSLDLWKAIDEGEDPTR